MNMMNIEGTWRGVIYLGDKYRKLKGKEIYFDLDMEQMNDKIKGISRDTGGFSPSPDPAKINGNINGIEINFVKQYTTNHIYNNGTQIIDKSKPGPEIFYKGTYDEQEESYSGEWIMKIKLRLFGPFSLTVLNLNGTWNMKRK